MANKAYPHLQVNSSGIFFIMLPKKMLNDMAYTWYNFTDEITRMEVYTIDGHQLYGDSDFVVRIFRERVIKYSFGTQTEYRFFPQIDNERLEERWEIGDAVQGYRKIKEAMKAAEEELEKLIAQYPDHT
ncbi:hypothetical protein [Spirosoma sp. 209]|uniref:hypothetical protein n=1 Tax=Spirosoma sp. 209 TaxID=1955701 RepID=UPI00111679E6|nr:hypothetical protein [Spirosoma sp. 209]